MTDGTLDPSAGYMACNWCGDPGHYARFVVIDTDSGEEAGKPVRFVTCQECLDKFLTGTLGWPRRDA